MKAQEYYNAHIANAYEDVVDGDPEELREKHLEVVEMLEDLFDEAIEEDGAYVGDILVGGEDGITDFEDFVSEAESIMTYSIGDIFDALEEFYEEVSQWEVERR